jgi:hypothetical protein
MLSPKKAKEHCGYSAKPVLPTCGNCGAFASDKVVPAWMLRDLAKEGELKVYGTSGGTRVVNTAEEVPESYKIEAAMRCTDHGFATKKMAACKLWRPKQGA